MNDATKKELEANLCLLAETYTRRNADPQLYDRNTGIIRDFIQSDIEHISKLVETISEVNKQ